MREKPNFAENWNNEARKPMKNEKLNENWITEFRETREKRNLSENFNQKPILY